MKIAVRWSKAAPEVDPKPLPSIDECVGLSAWGGTQFIRVSNSSLATKEEIGGWGSPPFPPLLIYAPEPDPRLNPPPAE